jgi:hypothetical protein
MGLLNAKEGTPQRCVVKDLTPSETTVLDALEKAAKEKRTITYSEVGELIDTHPRIVGRVLYYLQTKLNHAGYPPLNFLVESKSTGIPGAGVNEPHRFSPQFLRWKGLSPIKVQEYVWRYYANELEPGTILKRSSRASSAENTIPKGDGFKIDKR